MTENEPKNRKKLFIVIFLILILILAEVYFIFLKKPADQPVSQDYEAADVSRSDAEEVRNSDTENVPDNELSAENTKAAEEESITRQYQAPPEDAEWEEKISTKKVDAVLSLNIDNEKLLYLDLKDIAEEDEIIETLTFKVHSKDENIALGEFKCGYGISVYDNCDFKTNKNWYQDPKDFSVPTTGGNCTVVWRIPDTIKNYVNISSGELLFGYWWGDSEEIVVEEIECKGKVLVK